MSLKKLIILAMLCPFVPFAQVSNENIEKRALSEAQAMDITTQQQALEALKKRGIDENQARQMARMRGINFDEFLRANFKSTNEKGLVAPLSNSIVDTSIKIVSSPVQIGNIQESTKIALTASEVANYFGYDIFLNNPFAQKEYLVGNIDEGYIIAPGDVLRVLVFGDNSMQLEAKVDINGNINIPNFGVFMASGNNFATLRNRLKTYLGKYFSGLLSTPQRTFLDVSLTQIRPTSVTVLGEATTPGPHLVSGFATVLNALYAAGGIKTSGSLRTIKVYRNNQLLKEVDLYDYITSGKLDNDIRLANNDIIFIAPRISSVTLNGAVKKPFIYELKKSEGLMELLKYSSGLQPNASVADVIVKRIIPFENRDQKQVYDRFLTSVNYDQILKKKENFVLENGDEVTFNYILDKVLNNVKIAGSINQPGTYPLDKYTDLKSLIRNAAKDLNQNTYLGKVDIFKVDLTGKRSFTTYNLDEVLNGKGSVKLENDDSVYVYSVREVVGEKLIKINGFGSVPKTLFWRQGLSLFDLIFQSTSFEELQFQSKLLTSRVDLKRFNIQTGLYDIIQYSLDNMPELRGVYLNPYDEVFIYSKDVYTVTNKKIEIKGLVNSPGVISLKNDMTVEDAILEAGGFKEYADQEIIVVNREKYDAINGVLSERFEVSVDLKYLKGLNKKSLNSFKLMNNDFIYVRKMKGVEARKKIEIQGEVFFPSIITLEKEVNSLKEILEAAGGLKSTANLSASIIYRNTKPLIINLEKLIESEDKYLEDGDIVFIASNSGIVSTLGAIQNENQYIWEKDKKAKYYIKLSGGKIRKDADESYIIFPNSKTRKINWLHNPKVLPNSKIVVNRKIIKPETDKEKFFDKFLKIITIITSSLTSAVLASKL